MGGGRMRPKHHSSRTASAHLAAAASGRWIGANFMRFAWPTASQRRHRQHAASRQRSAARVGACKQKYARAEAALARRYTRATGPKFDSFAHFEAWLSGTAAADCVAMQSVPVP